MKLDTLKAMIKEEYSAYTEQAPAPGGAAGAAGAAGPAPGAPAAPAGKTAAPAVKVSPGDIDAEGDEDSEDTLRAIYDMLKAHFEGEDSGADDADDDVDVDDADEKDDASDADDADSDDEDEDDDAEALQERFKKLANIIKG